MQLHNRTRQNNNYALISFLFYFYFFYLEKKKEKKTKKLIYTCEITEKGERNKETKLQKKKKNETKLTCIREAESQEDLKEKRK